MIDDLYSARILSLAANLPHAGRLSAPQGTGEKVAKLCGSKAIVDVILDDQGHVAEFAQEVKACALGQAAATLLARHSMGIDYSAMRTARDEIWAWMKGEGDAPTWPEFDVLLGVKGFPARHGAVILPFDVAVMLLDGA